MHLKYILLLWILFLSFAYVPGKMEGKYFPVIGNITVTTDSNRDLDDRTSNIFLSYDKFRDCSFRSAKFYLFDENKDGDNQYMLMNTVYNGYENVRFSGRHNNVGPWFVRASAEDLQNMSVVIRHSCSIYYETITRIRVRDGEIVEIKPYE